MTLTTDLKYAMLFVLYLSRAGESTPAHACANLDLSKVTLNRVIKKLIKGDVIFKSKKSGNGYSLKPDCTVYDVLYAVNGTGFLELTERFKFKHGQPEQRALVHYISGLHSLAKQLLNRKVTNVMKELVANEMATLERLGINGLEN